MKIKFVNRGLQNILEPLNISEDMIEHINIGESMFIIMLKSGAFITRNYKLTEDE